MNNNLLKILKILFKKINFKFKGNIMNQENKNLLRKMKKKFSLKNSDRNKKS